MPVGPDTGGNPTFQVGAGAAAVGGATTLMGGPAAERPIILGRRYRTTGQRVLTPHRGIPVPDQEYYTFEDEAKTPTAILMELMNLPREEFLKVRNRLIAAGIVSVGAEPAQVLSAYKSLLSNVGAMQDAGTVITPDEYIDSLIRLNGNDPEKIGGAEDYGEPGAESPQPFTQTEKSVYDLSPEDARAVLEQSIRQLVGRDPTEEEIEDFINAAQTKAMNNPATITRQFTPGGTGFEGESSSVTSSGGETVQQTADGTLVTRENPGFGDADVTRMAERAARSAPDYASYQAVATYFPAFLNALGSTV